jgi:cell division protein ZapA (FtsZ GTPase activity inhibitor)
MSQEFTITLLGKSVPVKCTQEQTVAVRRAADALEERLKELQSKEHIWGHDEMLAVTSLNVMNEFLQLRDDFDQYKKMVKNQANAMAAKITYEECLSE